ncbi:MAG: HAD-IA family hydrolase [Deltaproteobacteria bacterium]|nr:HAD-IA family hydrolase [Deltaproteobacteria bacterium]
MAPVVTFDAGQTLVDLDLDFLARRLGERGVEVTPTRLAAAAPAAWKRFDELNAAGIGHPWKQLMTTLLAGAGADEPAPLVDWLWDEQPRANLWRKPIEPIIALAKELAARGVRTAVLSNSEGGLRALFEEIGLAHEFHAIIDSGVVGIDKPDPRIFAHTLEQLGGRAEDAVHIGDSWTADIIGALGAGWRGAIYYPSRANQAPAAVPARAVVARDADEMRRALTAFGI